MPKVMIFAGANGTGKTTLANSVLGKDIIYINADEIRRKERKSSMQAGRKAIESIAGFIRGEKDFAFETTMSGLTLNYTFALLEKHRYYIVVFYLFVYPRELLIERVRERIKKGGHPVAIDDILRRYYRSADNFWNRYRHNTHEWVVINNSESSYHDIAVGKRQQVQIKDKGEYDIFQEVVSYAEK